MLNLNCIVCNSPVQRTEAQERQRKREGYRGPCCSPSCSASLSTVSAEIVTLTCLQCETEFERLARDERSRKKRGFSGPFCSISCSSRYHSPRPAVERFMEKFSVSETGCWLWQGADNGVGHPKLRIDGKSRYAHRFAFRMWNGRPPEDGAHLHHVCEQSSCVNPLHLVELTPQEHMEAHERRGESSSASKLSKPDVLAIREEYAAGSTQRGLAAQFGVSKTQIGHIVRREQWTHV